MLDSAVIVSSAGEAILEVRTSRKVAHWFANAPGGRQPALHAALLDYMERHPRES
jgi:hypothetical protein